MTKNSRNKITRLMSLACVCAIAVGSLAYFTDRVERKGDDGMKVEVAKENIEIVPTDPTPDPGHTPNPDDPSGEIEYIWGNNNPDTINKVVEPGDKTDLSYNIKNGGPGAMDVRETFVLTVKDKAGAALAITDYDGYEAGNAGVYAPQYWLFKAAQADKYGAFEYDSATEIDNVRITKLAANSYKFEMPTFVLNGTSETVAGGVNSKELKYQLVFDKYAQNQFQASKCVVDYVVEVKQHTNDVVTNGTFDDDAVWSEIRVDTITMGANSNYKAVLKNG